MTDDVKRKAALAALAALPPDGVIGIGTDPDLNSSTIPKHVADRSCRDSCLEPRFEPGEIRFAIDTRLHIGGHR